MSVESFIEEHNGELTPQQATQMLDMALNGDTATAPTPKVEAPAESSEPTATVDEPVTYELTADNAVIMAKDGKHTIPFERLQQAREAEQQARLEREQAHAAAQQAIAELEQLKQQLAQSSQPTTQQEQQLAMAQQAINNGFDPKVFGDFDEAGLAKGLEVVFSQQQQTLEQLLEQKLEAKLQQALAPMAQKQQMDENQSHYQAILAAHPDVESVAESQEFSNWIDSQPSYAQQAIDSVLKQGTAQQIVEVLNNFKADKTPTDSQTNKTDMAQQAKQAIANTKPNVPASLSDINGGRVEPNSPDERVAKMNGNEMLEEMASWSPEKITQFLNKGL